MCSFVLFVQFFRALNNSNSNLSNDSKLVSEINFHPLKMLNCNALSFEKFCKQNFYFLLFYYLFLLLY